MAHCVPPAEVYKCIELPAFGLNFKPGTKYFLDFKFILLNLGTGSCGSVLVKFVTILTILLKCYPLDIIRMIKSSTYQRKVCQKIIGFS